MKLFLSFFFVVTISVQALSQQVKYDSASVGNEFSNFFIDSTAYPPYPVTVNHDKYKNQFMKMLIQKKYPQIISIVKTKAFKSVWDYTKPVKILLKSDSSIMAALTKLRNNLPDDIPITANYIYEERIFADKFRYESWIFTNTKGTSSQLTVIFTNGQITNILITI